MPTRGRSLQFACFSCRKCFKRLQASVPLNRFMPEIQRKAQIEETSQANLEREYICPNCGGPSSFMGIDFKAPKASDAKGWQKVEQFIRSGKVYYRGVS